MNRKAFASGGCVYTNYEYIKGYAFQTALSGHLCALLPRFAATFALSGGNCARFSRFLECLPPGPPSV